MQLPCDPGRAKPRSYLPIGERARYTQALIVDDRPPKPLTAEARQYQQSQASMPTTIRNKNRADEATGPWAAGENADMATPKQ